MANIGDNSIQHKWNISPKAAIAMQRELAGEIVERGHVKHPRLVAGFDVAFDKRHNKAFGASVLIRLPGLSVVESVEQVMDIAFPYVPGLLSFREGPMIVRLFKALSVKPDLLMFDGQGVAHPRGIGIASHMGLILGLPSIGCGKSRLFGEIRREPGRYKGESSNLYHPDGHVIGRLLRTRDAVKPVYVSVGHRISLDVACNIVLACTDGLRIPVPTRLADKAAAECKKRWLCENSNA